MLVLKYLSQKWSCYLLWHKYNKPRPLNLPFTQTLDGSIVNISLHDCFRICVWKQKSQHEKHVTTLFACYYFSVLLWVWPHRVDNVFEGMKSRQHREDLFCTVCYFSKLWQKHNIKPACWWKSSHFSFHLEVPCWGVCNLFPLSAYGRKVSKEMKALASWLELSSPALMITEEEVCLALSN